MIITYIAWVIMFASWCVAYRTISSLQKELNRFKYNESHYKAVLKKVEDFSELWIAVGVIHLIQILVKLKCCFQALAVR